MASKRRAILEAGLARLAAIRVDDGFNTDAGNSVALNDVPELGKDDPDVTVAILVPTDEVTKQVGRKLFIELPIEIQGIAKIAPTVPGANWHPWLEAEDVLEDIKRAWELDDMTFGGLLNGDMERIETENAEREPGTTTVGISIRYLLRYSECWGQPEA